MKALLSVLFISTLLIVGYTFVPSDEAMGKNDIPYSEVLNHAREGRVQEILVRSNPGGFPSLIIQMKDGRTFNSVLPTLRLDESVMQLGVAVRADNGSTVRTATNYVAGAFSFLTMIGLVLLVFFMLKQYRNGPLEKVDTPKKGKKNTAERVTFADVAGQDEAKSELEEVVEFLKNPDRFEKLGARIPKGVLLEGDPGNGKTLLAKAVAGESGVAFYHLDASGVVEMFAGMGPRRIRAAFKECRKHSPCILFIDELDSIGKKRGQGARGAQNEYDSVLNQLLTEMDGISKGKERIVVIAATNRADMLDPALVRPGRLDRRIAVLRPDLKGRAGIAGVHMRKLALEDGLTPEDVAKMSPGFSGAEVANLVNEAAIVAARNGREKVTLNDFKSARDRIIMGAERKSVLLDEQERWTIAVHEAGHAIMAAKTPGTDPIHRVTIIPRGRALGAVVMLPERDAFLFTRERVVGQAKILLAGRAAEMVILGEHHITGGAREDFRQITRLGMDLMGKCGFGKHLAAHDPDFREGVLSSPDSMARLEREVTEWIEEIWHEVHTEMEERKYIIKALAERLLEVETMSGDEVMNFLKGMEEY
jgi:cell division protease FtsH